VQVGAFTDIRNAESLVERLIESGYDAARIERETKDEVLFHCVRVGRFSSRDEAEAQAAALERRESLGTRIVRKEAR
jgi:cell division septation protein DedD